MSKNFKKRHWVERLFIEVTIEKNIQTTEQIISIVGSYLTIPQRTFYLILYRDCHIKKFKLGYPSHNIKLSSSYYICEGTIDFEESKKDYSRNKRSAKKNETELELGAI